MKKAIGCLIGVGLILTLLYGMCYRELGPTTDVERVPELKAVEE